MRDLGDEAEIQLVMLDGDVTGIAVAPWGEIQLSAGRAGLRVRLNADELRDLAARCLMAAETVDSSAAVAASPIGHA